MKVFFYISLATMLLSSCGELRSLQKEEVVTEVEPRPTWINDRPISAAYYIGIGSSSKATEPLDFASKAKNNAFNDLASEISVTIKGESFLNVLEVNRNFQEQFMSQVNAVSYERVEGFEIVDSWQDKDEYWIYYRLSKSKHEEIKAAAKKQVLDASYDSYKRGVTNVEDGQIHSAVNDFLTGLQNMETYWNEPNSYTLESGTEIYLDNALFSKLQETLGGLNLEVPMNEIILDASNHYQMEVGVKTTYNGREVGGIPLRYHFDQGKYARDKGIITNNSGIVSATVRDVNIKNQENALLMMLDLDNMVKNFKHDEFMSEVIKNLPEKKIVVPIKVVMPTLYVESNEMNLGYQLQTSTLANALKSEVSDNGFGLTSNFENADYIVQIVSGTNAGGTSQGFHVTYLEFEIVVTDRNANEIIYQDSRSNVKGLQLNFDSAGMEAYKKGVKIMEKNIADELMKKIL